VKKLVIAALLLVATTYALAATTKEDATERLKNAGDVLHEYECKRKRLRSKDSSNV
jgi:hypothetical protein